MLPEGLKQNTFFAPKSAIDDVQLVIYLPYLHWDSYKHMQERAALIKRRLEDMRARPVDTDVANGRSMESKLIWQYLTSNLPLHCRRTLDQFGYPSLRNTASRDADQVLYRRTKLITSMYGALEDVVAKVLMVDQLWLWILDGGEFV